MEINKLSILRRPDKKLRRRTNIPYTIKNVMFGGRRDFKTQMWGLKYEI